jgi:CRISPR-associated protein Csc3
MFFIQFLRDQIPPDDHVMLDFVEHIVPKLFEIYTDTSAKGGDHSKNHTVDETTRRKFEAKDDQSMASHLLNGIFPTMRLLTIIAQEGLSEPFSDQERRIYILSYMMHDVDKIQSHNAVLQGCESVEQFATHGREQIERAKRIVGGYLQECEAEKFLPNYTDYLEEITYLVVNTQQQWGTHLHTHLWDFRLKERRIFPLRDLCRFSDLIAYLIPSPSAILLSREAKKLTTILAGLSNDELVFCYHQLRETRGLLTNVINTGLTHLFTEGHEGIWTYLFFSDGVVYIKRKSLSLSISTGQIVDVVQQQLRQICAGVIKKDAPGFKFSIQGIVKHPAYYYEFISLEEYVDLLARFTVLRTYTDITAIPLQKLRQMQEKGEIPADLPCNFVPDKRIGMFSRFLSIAFNTLLGSLDKKQQALREQVEQEIVRTLDLTPYWEQSKAIPNKGGVEYRWFWLGACYLQDHRGLDPNGDELKTVFTRTFDLIIQLAGDALRAQMPQQYLIHLTRYLDSIVEVPLALRAGGSTPDFAAEFERYAQAKSKKRKLLCTLCNSEYPTEEQADSSVLFQPYVYKNKLSLYAGKSAGGICAICALELMLRQILLKGQLRLTGSKFEAQKTKYLTVYPNFFFTHETGAMIRGVLQQLKDINFFTVRKQLMGRDRTAQESKGASGDKSDMQGSTTSSSLRPITVKDLWSLSVFAAPVVPDAEVQVIDLGDDDDDESAESTATESESQEESMVGERSYIKYRPQDFPGLFLFGVRAGRDDATDTASWAMPAFLALALPLVTSTKVVISEMSLPLFTSGHDFPETVIFDAPHPYLDWLLRSKRVRVNQLLSTLRRMTSIYRVNIDTYADKGKPHWGHLSTIARELATDPLFLFSYLRRQERIDSKFKSDIAAYLHIYTEILEADMSKIEHCVDRYTVFYHGGYKSHSILKPVDIAAKAIINSPTNIEEGDLLWQIQGELKSWLDRVRNGHAAGWAIFRKTEDVREKELPAIEAFVKGFYEEVFVDYCQGERGLLRSRINRFKDGCEAYYTHQRILQKIQERSEQEQEQEQEQEVAAEVAVVAS